ncbi:MAG TPA: sugar porter family MFS transporter [Alphaproteobacteria bacterium]|nr:sugar porter family MFS transporter [Alphaproteobacteria bacterium]
MITTTQTQTSDLKAEYNLGYVWLISIVAAMGGLLFGYDWVVIGGAKLFFEAHFNLPSIAQSLSQSWLGQFSLLRFLGLGTIAGVSGFANSCALLGCLAGALVAGALSDKFGRKKLLITSAFLFAITSIGNALAPNFTIFVMWRILGGVGIGLASNLSPMYIAEIAPAQMRGKLVSINQLTIVIGILLAQVINWALVYNLPKLATQEYIHNSWYGQSAWRWMFGLTAIPSLLFFIGMFLVPESPRWLAKNGKREPARAILRNIGGDTYSSAALADIEATLVNEVEKVNFRDLFEPKLFRILLLGVGLAVFQQWCGINVIFNYAQEIFQSAGYDISDVLKNIAWTGSVNMAFTFVALGMVDRIGRRPLMLFGAAGLAVIYAILALCYHQHVQGFPMLLLVLAAIACYSMSLAPVTWVVISEIFPNRIRGAAMAVAVAALWLACFVLTYSFPILIAKFKAAGSFSLFAGICVVGFFFIWFALPETKNKTLEQIERELVD